MKIKLVLARGIAGIMAFLMSISIAASTLTFQYAGMVNQFLNVSTSKIVSTGGNTKKVNYYKTEYGVDYTNKQSALKVETAVAAENILQAEEGNVLLKNSNHSLPLAAGSKITLFGNASYNSCMADSSIQSIPTRTLSYALGQAFGKENINNVLGKKVYSALGRTDSKNVVEAPIADVKKYASTWKNNYNDVALVVFARTAAEGNDTAMYSAQGSHMLGLQKDEKNLMEYLKEEKANGTFKKIVVLINADQMMELGWLNDYGIDACLLVGLPGAIGFEGTANILDGNANPSGHLVDAYASNSLSAPACAYAAANTKKWGNADEVNHTCTDNTNNGLEIDYYTVYAEGIYTGYKYYETRYEDSVLGKGNAKSNVGASHPGAWNYSKEVCFPFGYGLSYTNFDQKLQDVKYNPKTDKYEVKVKVSNSGNTAGRSVVQVYAQTPYGDYEKKNNVEKSAVQVVGFGKTGILKPGKSEEVTVEVERYMLASYDSHKAKGYIMSAGDYYLSIGNDAHDALNNILAAKGFTEANGMDSSGDKKKTYTWNQQKLDTKSYANSRFNGTKVTNQFDHADLNYYGVKFNYLSRSDWKATYPKKPISISANKKMMHDLNNTWYKTPVNAPAVSKFKQGANNGINFADMHSVDWDDEKTWGSFLDQLTVHDMLSTISDSSGCPAIDHVGMPALKRTDDNIQGGNLVATGKPALTWVSEVMTSRTWDKDRFSARGKMIAIEGSFCGVNEFWYGGGDIHRTPFSGRNNQYFSEDGDFSYIVGAYEAKAMQDNGVIYCIKHFVLNDQETDRESLNTFANEQAIRENNLRAFEGAFCEGGALSVMVSFNKVGVTYTATDKNLIQNVLRGEWGYKGHITTDGFTKNSKYKTHYLEMISTGVDYLCYDPGETAAAVKASINRGDGNIMKCLRGLAKNNIYVAAHSNAVNGLGGNSRIITVVPWWQTTLLIINAITFIGFVIALIVFFIAFLQQKRKVVKGN